MFFFVDLVGVGVGVLDLMMLLIVLSWLSVVCFLFVVIFGCVWNFLVNWEGFMWFFCVYKVRVVWWWFCWCMCEFWWWLVCCYDCLFVVWFDWVLLFVCMFFELEFVFLVVGSWVFWVYVWVYGLVCVFFWFCLVGRLCGGFCLLFVFVELVWLVWCLISSWLVMMMLELW